MQETIKTIYDTQILKNREKLFGISNIMAIPKIEKVVVNARVKRGGKVDEKAVSRTLEKITGQTPVLRKARSSISNFKIRQGMVVGASVNLRGQRAVDFLDKLINVTLPRVRDFSGISVSNLDGKGNLSIGFSEHTVFPEVTGDDVEQLHGLQITVVTTAKNNKDALVLFRTLKFPFKKDK